MSNVISLYTGAGGLDLGLEAAGFDVAVAVEMDKWSCRTVRANRKWSLIERDIHDVPSREIEEVSGLKPGDADLLVGGPPCQPFSKSGYWVNGDTKRLDDPRADTLGAYLRVLQDLQPRAFLLENVFGLTYKGKDEALRLLIDAIEKISDRTGTNYSVKWSVLNVADYGVPQIRERFFLIGSRDGRRFRFPEPTHVNPEKIGASLFPEAREPWRTAWDAIGDLNEIEHDNLKVGGQWGNLLPSIPEGKNYLFHTDRGDGLPLFGWRRRYWSFLLKLAKNLPSWTIQAQPGSAIGPFHWKSRKLSVQEMCRMQTFPDGYSLCGGRTEVQRQVGNAVPSLIAEVLGLAIRKQLLGERIHNRKIELLSPCRAPIPGPEPLENVPEEYHRFIGKHAAHPGTGKGHLING